MATTKTERMTSNQQAILGAIDGAWLTRRAIREATGLPNGSVISALRSLHDRGRVRRRRKAGQEHQRTGSYEWTAAKVSAR